MSETNGGGLGWCESKQANCSWLEQLETAKTIAEARIEEVQPSHRNLLEKFLIALGHSSPYAYTLKRDIDVNQEKEKVEKFDLLLARNCGSVCIVEGALETIEFRDLISVTATCDEIPTMQPKSLEFTTEELK